MTDPDPVASVVARHGAANIVRYRYRIYPTASQQQQLARAFGCARVVFNDAIAERDRAYQGGEKLSDAEVQHRVVTKAKRTPERAWLGEVSSVVLGQACQDARRAYRNWFESMAGTRKGRRIGKPRFRRKHGRQSIRLTRNGFILRPSGKVFIAKIGDVRVRWSRDLPSVPSSVTVTRDADGRHYASFVVERHSEPLPAVNRAVGVDLGLGVFAAIVATDGMVETVANPRYLRASERRLRKAQQSLSRKQKGSRNRGKACRHVAVAHRKVRDRRLDHAHKLAGRLIRENQTVAVEYLCVVGLARTWLAKSVHDAGWGQFTRLLQEKADRHGRTLVKVSRFEPTSQVCSACGTNDGPKPLNIRSWTCGACSTTHDRDVNAARNILVAAGLAETQNACGGDVRRGLALAVASEAGTHRSIVRSRDDVEGVLAIHGLEEVKRTNGSIPYRRAREWIVRSEEANDVPTQ